MHRQDALSPILPKHGSFSLKRLKDIEKSQYMRCDLVICKFGDENFCTHVAYYA